MNNRRGSPLARKLGLKAESRLVLLEAPDGWEVPDLPEEVAVPPSARPEATRRPA